MFFKVGMAFAEHKIRKPLYPLSPLEEPLMDPSTKENLANRNIWSRGLYMLLFVLAYAIAETILTVLVLFQFVAALITRRVNEPLQRFGTNLSMYVYQILQFQTFNSETRPFPFSDWPEEEPGETPWSTADEVAAEEQAPDPEPAEKPTPAQDIPPAPDETSQE
jgi:hypothetical protein